jgi:cytochrome c biogenesis protein CcmG, thiol:disulfide interchange protein DsbE
LPSTRSSSLSDADRDPSAGPSRRARVITAAIALVALVAIVAVTVAVVASNDKEPAAQLEGVAQPNSAKVGEVAPDFELETLDGGTVRLSDFRGKPVVVNFWASWCNPCRQEFPLFRSALADARGKFALVGVDAGDLRSDARRFAREERATWPNGFDGDGTVARGYGVDPLPQTFFIRPDGTIASHVIRELNRAELDRELKKVGAT